MSFLAGPKPTPPPPVVNPADTANAVNNVRQRRLAGGGRNSTFLADAALSSMGATPGQIGLPKPTLTGAG